MCTKNNPYARWRLGELLNEAQHSGCQIEQDHDTGHIRLVYGGNNKMVSLAQAVELYFRDFKDGSVDDHRKAITAFMNFMVKKENKNSFAIDLNDISLFDLNAFFTSPEYHEKAFEYQMCLKNFFSFCLGSDLMDPDNLFFFRGEIIEA